VAEQDEFGQIREQCIDPLQHDYEVIRPIALFAETAAERSRQTGIERTVVGDKARRFVLEGMEGLRDQRTEAREPQASVYPDAIARYILDVKQLYPPIHLRELERIVLRKFGYKTNHHTLQRFLAPYDTPIQLAVAFPRFATFADAYHARWTVVRMAAEGWNKTSIAACLKLSRAHVSTILTAFERDGFTGLEDQRSRPPQHPDNQLCLPFLKAVLDLQQAYPRAGRFRIHGLLTQQHDAPPPSERTVGRAMAINRQFHGAPGPWQSAREAQADVPSFKHLPYRPAYRHHLWFTDIRYLVQLDGNWVYSLCVLEGYSRKMLVGMVSPHQDLTAVLQMLFAAVSEYGCPQAVVSDNGSVFTAKAYLALLRDLRIEPLHIEKGKPWQNLIEAQCKVQLRLADFHFEQAQTLTDVHTAHANFIETFNTTPHGAHRRRADGCHTPVEVLGWLKGRVVDPKRLRHLFGRTQCLRTVNRYGCVSVQRFYIYAENGLSRQRVAIWIYEGELTIEYQQTLLARYQCDYDRQQKRLHALSQPILYPTAFRSPQLELMELDDEQWRKFLQRPAHNSPSQRRAMHGQQLPLLELGM
jgi:putative transposase